MEGIRYLKQGESGLVVEFGTEVDSLINDRVHKLANLVTMDSLQGIEAIVPTYRSLLILFDPMVLSRARIIEHTKTLVVAALEEDSTLRQVRRTVIIPTCYGGEMGPDIGFVAMHNGIGEEEVIQIHSSISYKIYMMGFTPGFPYLGGMSPRIAAPRLDTPRTIIPSGSVGIAGTQTGLYPVESPGGWRLIGRTPLEVFDVGKKEPFLYQAGDSLRFKRITASEYDEIRLCVEKGTYTVETNPEEEAGVSCLK